MDIRLTLANKPTSYISMLKLFFQVLLLGLGAFLTYSFGQDMLAPIRYKATGSTVEGRISGFLAGRNTPSVQREPDGVRKGKRRARRPVFRYPTAPDAVDSLEARGSTGALFTVFNYALYEKVTVVFEKGNPANAHIFGFQPIFTAFLCTLLGLYMIKIGITGSVG